MKKVMVIAVLIFTITQSCLCAEKVTSFEGGKSPVKEGVTFTLAGYEIPKPKVGFGNSASTQEATAAEKMTFTMRPGTAHSSKRERLLINPLDKTCVVKDKNGSVSMVSVSISSDKKFEKSVIERNTSTQECGSAASSECVTDDEELLFRMSQDDLTVDDSKALDGDNS